MTWAAALAGAVVLTGLTGTPVFSFDDDAINESSGLVDLGSLTVTTNDSGGDPLVFVVDERGRTVGRTTYTGSVVDTEALAPAGANAVWVGDIGDNNEVRTKVQVYRVPVGRGDRTVSAPAYDLVYPDGAHDAESLLYGPDKRLRIVTKGILGGRVYTAPAKLDPDRPNKLERGPEVPLWATDAALYPDGRHVIVRGYTSAMVATYPAFDAIGYVDLPRQQQGEGISIGRGDRIRLSSEGVGSKVLQVKLPERILQQLAPPGSKPAHVAQQADPVSDPPRWPWLAGGGVLLGVLAWRVLRRGY